MTPPGMPTWTFRTYGPRVAPSQGKPPLLVMLHGIGADEHDLFPLAGRLDRRLVVVSLRAPRPYHGGHAWFDLDFRPDGTVVPDVTQARTTLADLGRWLDAAPAAFGTDPARTYLLGFSQGAMMSLGMLHTAPEGLAGVVALSGRSPDGLFEATAARDAIARVPLFVAHGTQDEVLPVASGRATRALFEPLSRDFTYREFPIGHGISDEELSVVAAWLSQRLGSDDPPPRR